MDNADRLFPSVQKILLASTDRGSMAFYKQDREQLEVFRLGRGSHGGSSAQRTWRSGVEQRRTAGAFRMGEPGHRLSVWGAREDGKAVPESKWILSDRVAESIKEPQI